MIKKYKEFIVESNEDIHSICKKFGIKNFNKQLTVNSDGSIDVDNVVDLRSKKLTKLPLKFGKVTKNFYCNINNLTSLDGCPKEVGGYFDCSYNNLTTLKGAPDKINGSFYCQNNNLISFKYLPLADDCYFYGNPINEFLKYFDDYRDGKNLVEYLRLFEDIVQYPYLDDLEFEELAKCLKVELPEDWRDSVKSYKMLSQL